VADVLLSIRELGRDFGGLRAVDGIDLDVERGQIVGVIGPNGAGKTTLLNCVSGLLRPNRGTVIFDGRNIERLPAYRVARLGIARTLQLAEHFKNFRVADFVLLGRMEYLPKSLWACGFSLPAVRRKEKQQVKIVSDLLERFDLTEYRKVMLRELPYGTQRLIDLVRALAMEPQLLLLDEPTSGSSEFDRRALRRYLATLRDEGLTTVVVDHDVRFVSDTCDHVMAMALGRPLSAGTPAEVLSNPEVVASYLGNPKESLIDLTS
jgi:branched-chain amino acid transport system ATP-binding protein